MACRNRRRGVQYKSRYGSDLQTYNKFLKVQKRRCAICGKKETAASKTKLSFDHDHETNEVRGLLCHRCNIGIGMFKDNIKLLRAAVRYLKEGVKING